MRRIESSFGRWVIGYPWWIIVLSFLVMAWAGSGIFSLSLERDYRVFFSEENPQFQALKALENTYMRSDAVLFVVAPRDGRVFTKETLAAVSKLTDRSWHMPYAGRVDSITNYQYIRAEGDDLFVGSLVENAEHLSDSDLTRIRNIALSEPSLVNRLVSPTGHVTGVIVTILLPGQSPAEVAEVAEFARESADFLRDRYPTIEIYMTGAIMFNDAYGEVAQNELSNLVPVIVILLVCVTALSLRSIAGTCVMFLVIVMSMITGMGLAGWLGLSLNPASANSPVVILTMALANGIHVLVTMLRQLGLGRSKQESILESLHVNLQAVFLTSVTTAIGFLMMNFSDSPPFRDLGNVVAMGVVAALFYSLFLLPSLMMVLPVRVQLAAKGPYSRWGGLAEFVIGRRRLVFWGMLGLVLVSMGGTLRLEFNDEWPKYFSEQYDIRVASDFATKNLTGFEIVEYSLESGRSGGINDPEYLAKVEEFANWFRQQPRVAHVNTIVEVIKRLNKTMHGGEDDYYRIPRKRELAAQYLLLYELSLPFGLDLNHQINVDKSATRMTVLVRDTSTRELHEMEERAREWLRANAPASMFTPGSGLSMVWASLSQRNTKSMLGASFGALALISGILIFALRSLRLGIVSLVPNLAPAFVAFGLWGWTVGQVGLGHTVVVALTLGIVVDDTIHFLTKYLRARREAGMDSADAVRHTFQTVGKALLVTSVALVVGFLVLALSGYKVNADLGLMAALTISLALAMDFLLLPTLLLKVEKRSQ